MVLRLLPGVELVGTASNGQEAVELTAETRPDIVLMDLRVPDVDGVEATRHLRAEHPASLAVQVGVIVLAAASDAMAGWPGSCSCSSACHSPRTRRSAFAPSLED
jgi:DNA-binding NarL/FixJ family response regulator